MATTSRSTDRGAGDQARQLHVIKELSAAVAGVIDPGALADIAVERMRELMHVDAVTLRWWDPAADALVVLSHAADGPDSPPQLPQGLGVAGMAFSERRPFVVSEYQAWEHAEPFFLRAGVRSVAAVPLLIQKEAVGVLIASSMSGRTFSDAEVGLLELVAAQVASGAHRARLLEEKEVQRRRLEALHQVMVAAAGVLDPRALAETVTRMAADVVGTDFSRLTAFEAATGRLCVLGTNDPDLAAQRSFEVGAGGSAMGMAFEAGRPIVVEDYVAAPFALEFGLRAGTRSVLAVPLLVRDRPIGALSVISRTPRSFSAEDVQILSMLGSQVAPVIEAATRHAELSGYRRRLALLLASAPLVLFALDPDARFTFIEGKAAAALGLVGTDLLGRSVFEAWPGAETLERGVRAALGGRATSFGLGAGPAGVDLDVDLVPQVAETGFVEGIIGVAVDVTERRRARDATAANEAQSRFLAAMSHELRTPLNSILGFAQLLAAPDFVVDEERRQRYVGNIAKSGRHLLDLINDVLDLSRVRSGQLQLALEDVDVRALVEEALDDLRPLAQSSGLALASEVPPHLVALADKRSLRQVVLNLLSNAIKFTPPGGTVCVRGGSRGGKVAVTVADTGIGIADSDLSRIFDEFVQVDAGLTRRHEGTGLGLALSRRLMEEMSGRLTAASEPGVGSQFTLTVPSPPRRPAPRHRPAKSAQGGLA
ncbi:MAG: GAF domain-containing protein, partial [Candidatus Dormibacterales bacterium]